MDEGINRFNRLILADVREGLGAVDSIAEAGDDPSSVNSLKENLCL